MSRVINLGRVTGKSAYEIAQEHGYEGTESEWLETLHGADGSIPNLQIGSVTTLPAGSDATASITGTQNTPLLNLGIPEGASGAAGGTGAGAPVKTVTELEYLAMVANGTYNPNAIYVTDKNLLDGNEVEY